MKSIFDIALDVLLDICKNKKEFSLSIKDNKVFGKNVDKKSVISICGLVLRNYFLIKYFSNNILNFKKDEEILSTGVVFAAVGFNKVKDTKSVFDWYKNYLSNLGNEYDKNIESELNSLIKNKKNYQFDKINKGSLQYFSIVDNLPIWFLNMINKQFNRDIMYKVAKECSRMPKQYAFKPEFFEVKDELKDELNSFKEIKKDLLMYVPEKSIKSLGLSHQNYIFNVQLAEVKMLEKLPSLENKEITVMLSSKDNGYVPLLNKYYKNNKLHVFYKDEKRYLPSLNKLNTEGMNNLDFHQANEDSLEAYLSSKQDLIVYYPESSNLELFRRLPDYGITFNPSCIDGLIEKQANGLTSLDDQLASGGYLVYALPTINIKEMSVQIYKFLEKHSNYKEVYSEVFFPNEKDNSTYYYCILKKD